MRKETLVCDGCDKELPPHYYRMDFVGKQEVYIYNTITLDDSGAKIRLDYCYKCFIGIQRFLGVERSGCGGSFNKIQGGKKDTI